MRARYRTGVAVGALLLLAACGTPQTPTPTTQVLTVTVPTLASTAPVPSATSQRTSPLSTATTTESTRESTVESSSDALLTNQTPDAVTVLSVYDGDTITVQEPTGPEHVRILGINAPELENKNLKIAGQCYGEQSGDDLRTKLVGADVILTVDPEQGTGPDHRDKYGRLLRYVSAQTNGAPLDVGAYQLQAGNAWVYEQYPVSKTPEYETIQQQAQADHAGLWGPCE